MQDTTASQWLEAKGCNILWWEGTDPATWRLKRVLSVESPALQVFWCQFMSKAEQEDRKGTDIEEKEEGELLQCVCVRESSCVSLFVNSGAIHSVPLPFTVCQVIPISAGLLVERQVPGEVGSDGLPTLFTLLHPMGDLCPVILRRPSATASSVTVQGFFSDAQLHCVGSCECDGCSILLLHHATSGVHSLWEIKPAKPEDIPAHVSTPHHAQGNVHTPQHPLSTSAPSHFPHFTPHTAMETPVEMVLASGRQRDTRTHLVSHASPFLLSGGGKGGAVKVGSGRSPFISRLQSPHVTKQTRSKSVSPPLLARISPFSQTINSNSWSTFYSNESIGDSLEPLLPQLCLHQLWEEGEDCRSSGAAIKVFSCQAIFGATYLYYLTPSSSQLWALPYRSEASLVFGKLASLSATQAIPFPALKMVLVLEQNGDLILYSGTMKVCVLDKEALIQGSDGGAGDSGDGGKEGGEEMEMLAEVEVVGVRDAMDHHFTMELSSGATLRCHLPPLYPHPTVEFCLRGISEVLPREIAHSMLASYYSSSVSCLPPSHPHSSHHHSSHSTSPLPPHFRHWLLSALAMANTSKEAEKTPWQRVQQLVLNDRALLTTVPALQLLAKRYSTTNEQGSTPMLATTMTTALLREQRTHTLSALHLVYEELKLYVVEEASLRKLAVFLHQLATILGWPSHADHYQVDFPALFSSLKRPVWDEEDQQMEKEEEEKEGGGEGGHSSISDSPPHILLWLYQRLRGKRVKPFPSLPNTCKRTAQVVKLYGLYTTPVGGHVSLSSLLSSSSSTSSSSSSSSSFSLDETAENKWNGLVAQSPLPYERVVLCLVEEGLTREDLESMPVGVALPLWDAVLRCQEQPQPWWPLAAYDIIGRSDIVKTMTSCGNPSALTMECLEKMDDGMAMDQEILKLHFPKDLRVHEVKRLLNSSKPVKIALTQKPEVSDHEFIEQQETHLLAICQRTMSLPVGRGMFTMATAKQLPTAPLAIPHLELTGRAPPRNSTVGLEHIEKPANMAQWAEFHNGVAAGLRIAPGTSQLDSTWILSNRTSSSGHGSGRSEEDLQRDSNQYAGFLLALGLSGHLTSLLDYELYEYLHDKHELTVVAVLLGIAAARVGSMQRSVASVLSIFLPPLLPYGAADMEVSHTIQTAGLVAMGMLYMASGNRHMTEVMLQEIGHIPGPELEFAEDRESYSLAAGMALGMITLGLGGNLPGLTDLRLVDQLSIYISGGLKREVLMAAAPSPSHLVLETEMVNTHVTSPGATVALGLMYLKTNDISVARRLDAPNTLYELDCIRPDFMILRAVSRSLIMWDEVEPTQDWIEEHIPEIVRNNAFQGDQQNSKNDPSMDYQTFSQALVCILAGCSLGMGLRYAGTCDPQAHACLLKNTKFLLSKMESPASAEQAGKPCLEMCINAVLLSVALVMSGSGDLEVLRIIRQLHVRVRHPEVTYGSHMATHMALGLLFLGGCRYSLSRSNKAVAALYISLFPLFPSSSTDSRCHLQALRHLYVLAAEPRVLVTRDVETGLACSVDMCVRGGGWEVKGRTPCILPEWDSIQEITVCSPLFWPVTLSLNEDNHKIRRVLSQSGTVYVKRRTGGFSQQLAKGTLPPSLSPHVYSTCKVKGKLKLSEDVASNPLLSSCYKSLLTSKEDSPWQRFVTAALLECVSEEKLPVFPAMLHLEKVSSNVLSSSLPPNLIQLWQLKLAWALASWVQQDSFQLLHLEHTEVLLLRVKQLLYQCQSEVGEGRVEEVLRWYMVGRRGGRGEGREKKEEEEEGEEEEKEIGRKEAELLAVMLLMYDIPPRHLLALTARTTLPQLLMRVQALQAPPTAVVCLLPLMKDQLPQPLDLPFL